MACPVARWTVHVAGGIPIQKCSNAVSQRLRLPGGHWTERPQCSCSLFSWMGAPSPHSQGSSSSFSPPPGGRSVGTPASGDGAWVGHKCRERPGASWTASPHVCGCRRPRPQPAHSPPGRLLCVRSASKEARTLATTHPLLCPSALSSSHSCPASSRRAGGEEMAL